MYFEFLQKFSYLSPIWEAEAMGYLDSERYKEVISVPQVPFKSWNQIVAFCLKKTCYTHDKKGLSSNNAVLSQLVRNDIEFKEARATH